MAEETIKTWTYRKACPIEEVRHGTAFVIEESADNGFEIASVHGACDERTIEMVEADVAKMTAAPELYAELAHLTRLLEPLERDNTLDVPGLATLNGARAALARAAPDRGEG